MKRFVYLLLSIFLLLIGNKVYAKDTVFSINKYDKEELKYIIKDKDNKGFVVLGTYELKKEKKILLVNYNKDGSIKWELDSKDLIEEEAFGLSSNNDNYVVLVKKDAYTFWLIDKEGKLQSAKETNLYGTVEVTKIIEDNDNTLLIGSIDGKAFIAKYDIELNLSWIRTYDNTINATDIITTDNNYYAIVELDNNLHQLIKLELDGNIINVIKEDFEEKDNPKLINTNDSYIVYGVTEEVKLEDNKIGSYYIIKFDYEDQEIWDTIGTTPVSEDKVLKLLELEDDYYVLSTNSSDNSIEVTKVNKDGIVEEKVKKLKNNYYSMNDFFFEDNILYFIGQINCPQEDNCDYNHNSLFLVCSEDKVIEVEDKDSKTILIVTGIIVIAVVILYLIRKKKLLQRKKP